jgi:hypothetical protein
MIDYAINTLGYDSVSMIGLSGGGWTTTLASAIDTRISLSFPVAGSLPFNMYNGFFDSRDWEQEPKRPMYQIADILDWYVLGGIDSAANSSSTSRAQIQLLHMMDSCCWTACTRQTAILDYNNVVRSKGANFRTVVTAGE